MKTMSKRAASTRIPILGSRIPIPGQQLPPETVTTISTEITRKTLGKKVRYADKIGTLRFVGIVHFSAGVWCGIELSNAAGKNDGSVRGVRYFACPDGRGLMAPLSKVTAVDNEGNVDDEEGASGPHSMLFGISNQPNHNFPKTVRNTENVTTCDTNDQSFISDTRETTNLTKKLIRTNTFDVSDSTLGSSEADCTFSTSVDNKTVRCANETFTKLTYLNENHYTDETLDEGRNDPLSDVQRKDDISFNSDALTSSTNNDDQSLRDDLFSLSNRRRSILAGNINIRSNDTFNTKDGRNCRAEPPFNLKESEIKEPKLQLDVFVSVPNYSTPYSDVESSPRRRAKAAPVSLNFATDEEGNKRDSLEFEESLGILTPEQMIDGTGFIVSRTPSSENIGSLPNDFVNVKTDVKVELVSTPNPSVIEYSLGIIDENVLSSFSIETDHTMNIDLILDKSKERVIARIEQTPSPEELPLDPIPLSEPKSATTKSKTNSFITSITSITSLDTGYQGDGEMSRPASRGADHSPLTRRPIPRPAPRRPDPMTDSDFYTESDADNHEDHPLRGDRKAQVIDGTLYGVDPQAAADIYVNNRENMDSSGIFTDIDANTRTDELSSSVENANQANEAMDVSPTPSDSTTKTISENSQNHAVLILSKGLNSFDATKTTTDSKSSESNSKRKSLSSVASSPTSMRSPKHDPKDDSTKKHKTQKRSVSAQVKTVETKAKTETKKLPLKKPAGRWDAVMNKISKTPCEPNLKDIKSKVFSSIPASAARQSASQKPQSTKTRRSRTRAASNATPTKHAESVHSSLSDLSGASPAKKNNASTKKQRDVVRVTQVLTAAKLPPRSQPQNTTAENKKSSGAQATNDAKNTIRRTLFSTKEKKQILVKDCGRATVKGGRASPGARPPQQTRGTVSTTPKTAEALAILVQHLVFNVEAFRVPYLKREIQKSRIENEKILMTCDQLEQALADERINSAAELDEEKSRCQASVADLINQHHHHVTQINHQHSEVKRQLLSEHEKITHLLKNAHEEQLLKVKQEFNRLQKTHEQTLDILHEENDSIREQIDEKNIIIAQLEQCRGESDKLRKDYDAKELLFKEEITYLKEENTKLMSYGIDGKDTRLQDVIAESESLRAVLDIKQSENSELRKALAEANQKVETFRALEIRVSTLAARCEDLDQQLTKKQDREQRLLNEIKRLEDLSKEEWNQNRRLSLHNEELKWKLKQNKEVVSQVIEQAEEEVLHRSNLTSSFSERHNSNCLERTLSFRESYLNKNNLSNEDINMSSKKPKNSVWDLEDKVKGLVEKSDSVSYVLDMEERPEIIASRIVRRSFRNSTPPKNTPTKSPSNKRPRIKNPLSVSASASAIIPNAKIDHRRSRSASIRNGEDSEFLWPHQSISEHFSELGPRSNSTMVADYVDFEDFMWHSALTNASSPRQYTAAFRTANASDHNVDLEEDVNELNLPALPSEIGKKNGVQSLPVPKRLAGESIISESNSDDESTTSSSSGQL